MVRASQTVGWLTIITMATVLTGGGCRQAQTRSTSPTPMPGYESPRQAYEEPPPAPAIGIPPVPPSTAAIQGLEGNFGFTAPQRPATEPSLELPTLSEDTLGENIQPTGSEEDSITDATEAAVAVPLFSPLALPQKQRETPPVELDTSLFLIELFEEAAETPVTTDAVPTTVNGLTIQPWNADSNVLLREPQPWPADGITPSLVITPGPILPKWSAEPLPTRSANSRPRRLAIENSDSDIRAIE